MSTLRTNRIELSDGSKGIVTDFVVDGSAKAWVNYNAQAPVIRDSVNISSLTDMGMADFKHNHTSSMSGTNYSVSATWAYNDANVTQGAGYYNYAPTQRLSMQVGYSRINQFGSTDSGMSSDSLFMCIVNHGGLA